MVAIVFLNSTSEKQNQATLRVLINYFINYLKLRNYFCAIYLEKSIFLVTFALRNEKTKY